MTLIEALKSGKRFRRPEMANLNKHLQWYPSNQNRNDYNYLFKETDILADDWEIEPEPKPKLKAWLSFRTETELVSRSAVLYFLANGDEPDKTDDEFSKSFRRAPWLDQPE